jgi:hypothetical protein
VSSDVTVARPGILAIFNNVAPGREAEFEEWFQHEHLQERLAVPGFLLGRRYEAVSAKPRYFNYYVTRSVEVLYSADYRMRFKDMIRTVCRQTFHIGTMRGALAVAARFSERPDENAPKVTLENLLQDKGIACGEIWSAAGAAQLPLSEEERLRGGDRRLEVCLMVDTLRLQDAERAAGTLSSQFPAAAIGVYRLLCEISRGSEPFSTAAL